MHHYALTAYLISNGAGWVKAQRERFRSLGAPVAAADRSALVPYFDPGLLDLVRVASVPMIENPAFYRELEQAGYGIPLDFRQMAGITFNDTVLVARSLNLGGEPWASLLFHELVHVVQYRTLGVDEFIARYVLGWAANGFDYSAIPLEQDAYDLQRRFEAGESFSVELEVSRRLERAQSCRYEA